MWWFVAAVLGVAALVLLVGLLYGTPEPEGYYDCQHRLGQDEPLRGSSCRPVPPY